MYLFFSLLNLCSWNQNILSLSCMRKLYLDFIDPCSNWSHFMLLRVLLNCFLHLPPFLTLHSLFNMFCFVVFTAPLKLCSATYMPQNSLNTGYFSFCLSSQHHFIQVTIFYFEKLILWLSFLLLIFFPTFPVSLRPLVLL